MFFFKGDSLCFLRKQYFANVLLSFSCLICAVKLSEYQSATELDFYGHPYEPLRISDIDVSLFWTWEGSELRTFLSPPKLLSRRVDALSLTLSFLLWSVLRYSAVDELPPHLQWQENVEEVVFHRQDSRLNSVQRTRQHSTTQLFFSLIPMDMSSSSPVITDPISISPPLLGGLTSNLMPFSVMSGGCSSPSMCASRRKIEEVLVNGLLDAMKSSSPRKKYNLAFGQDNSLDEDPAYSAWLVSCIMQFTAMYFLWTWMHGVLMGLMLQSKCPSALTSFKQIVANAQGRRIAVFLDYDGTLSPIVDDPDKAFMSPVVNQNSLFQVLTFNQQLLILCLKTFSDEICC